MREWDTGEQADQSHAELYGRKHFIRVFPQPDDNTGRIVSFLYKSLQTGLTTADDGHFQHRKNAIPDDEQYDDHKLFP